MKYELTLKIPPTQLSAAMQAIRGVRERVQTSGGTSRLVSHKIRGAAMWAKLSLSLDAPAELLVEVVDKIRDIEVAAVRAHREHEQKFQSPSASDFDSLLKRIMDK